MIRITFSGAEDYPVTGYGPVIGRLREKVFGDVKSRVNTSGDEEWVNLDQLTDLVHAKLPPEIKKNTNLASIKERLRATPSEELNNIELVVRSLARQLTKGQPNT